MHDDAPGPEQMRLLSALIRVCGQYVSDSATYLDHGCLSAGEYAVTLLEDYGLLIPGGRGGFWTERANFLGSVKDFSDEKYEEIRARYLALPDREPFSPRPGYRSNQPDFQLAGLRLWVPSRALSKYSEMHWWQGPAPSADRLDVEVRLETVGAMATIQGELLTIGEVRKFRDDLQRLHDTSEGSVELVAYKRSLQLKLHALEAGELSGEITVSNPMYHNSLRSDLRLPPGHLPGAIAGLDHVLATFSVPDASPKPGA